MRYTLSIAFIWLGLFGFSQSGVMSPQKTDLSEIDLIDLPFQDNDQLFATSRSVEQNRTPKIFATPISTSIKFKTSGSRESSQSGRSIWRQRIRSQDAWSLNLGFTNFKLPPSAVLYLHSPDYSYVIGPISQKDNDDHLEWWSPVIPHDEVVVEVQVDSDEWDKIDFSITRVNHDFSGIGSLLSGSCNVDVICSEVEGFGYIDQYRDIIQSVGFMTIGGFQLCSGYLINNVRNDCTPYFMTAFHCNVTSENGPSVVVYWNYENSYCRIPNSPDSEGLGDGQLLQFNSGVQTVAGDDSLDFRLCLLDDEVDALYDPFFAGWNTLSESFDTTYCIHHPDGEEKRISVDYDTLTFYAEDVFIRVDDWESGTTEGGSSGSPLFSKDRRAIGSLSGGTAACGNSGFDDFSSLRLAWEGIRGTPETRLRDWLDPDGTGTRILDGKYCANAMGVEKTSFKFCALDELQDSVRIFILSGFEDGASVSIVDASPGIDFDLQNQQIQPGDTMFLRFSINQGFTGTLGSFSVLATDSLLQSRVTVNLFLTAGLAGDPVPMSPVDNVELPETTVLFSWEGEADTYDLELYSDTLMNPLVTFMSLMDNSILVSDLQSGQQYFWRVNSKNICGVTDWSSFSSFSILQLECLSIASDHDPITIPETPVSVQSTIQVPALGGIISDVNIDLIRGRHSFVSDLRFHLTSPSGTSIVLAEYPCSDEDDFNVAFDDESDAMAITCPFNLGNTFVPKESLSAFDGESAEGDWILTVDDDFNIDGGSLQSWSLNICVEKSETRGLFFQPTSIVLCEKDSSSNSIEIGFSEGFEPPVSLEFESLDGVSLSASLESSNNGESDNFIVTFPDFQQVYGLNQIRVITTDNIGVDTFLLAVTNELGPSEADLRMPADLEEEVDRTTRFEWEVLDDVDRSRLIIYSDADRDSVVFDTITKDLNYLMKFRLDKNTTYYWEVLTLGQCKNTESELYSFKTELSVSTVDILQSFGQLYPNPGSGDISLSLNQSVDGEISIYSILGQIVEQRRVNGKTTTFNVSEWDGGVYFLRLHIAGQIEVYKFVVK